MQSTGMFYAQETALNGKGKKLGFNYFFGHGSTFGYWLLAISRYTIFVFQFQRASCLARKFATSAPRCRAPSSAPRASQGRSPSLSPPPSTPLSHPSTSRDSTGGPEGSTCTSTRCRQSEEERDIFLGESELNYTFLISQKARGRRQPLPAHPRPLQPLPRGQVRVPSRRHRHLRPVRGWGPLRQVWLAQGKEQRGGAVCRPQPLPLWAPIRGEKVNRHS